MLYSWMGPTVSGSDLQRGLLRGTFFLMHNNGNVRVRIGKMLSETHFIGTEPATKLRGFTAGRSCRPGNKQPYN